jgi:uncharacterized protein (UPF0210 family)
VRIYSVALGVDLPALRASETVHRLAGGFFSHSRDTLQGAGHTVDASVLAAGAPDALIAAAGSHHLANWAQNVEEAAREAGADKLSIGRFSADRLDATALLADALAATRNATASLDLGQLGGRLNVVAGTACARAVRALAATTPDGLGSLRLAVTTGCPPNSPLPSAAYHAGGSPLFTVGVDATDLARDVIEGSTDSEVENRLVSALDAACLPIADLAQELATGFGYRFGGVELRLAPTALESLRPAIGARDIGSPGSLHNAAMLARAIRRTRVPRIGLSGLILAPLHDASVAGALAARPRSVGSLLVYAAIGSSGLEGIPIPGDVTEAVLAGVYLDILALSGSLGGRPLIAQLLPVPDGKAGEWTSFRGPEQLHDTRIVSLQLTSPSSPAPQGGVSRNAER